VKRRDRRIHILRGDLYQASKVRFRVAGAARLRYFHFVPALRRVRIRREAVARFEGAGLTPFLDRDETPGGAELTPSLVRALRRSRMLVVLLTPDVLDSEWVQQEVETFSRFRGRAITPINVDNYIARQNLEGTGP
jgi:TIR domain